MQVRTQISSQTNRVPASAWLVPFDMLEAVDVDGLLVNADVLNALQVSWYVEVVRLLADMFDVGVSGAGV